MKPLCFNYIHFGTPWYFHTRSLTHLALRRDPAQDQLFDQDRSVPKNTKELYYQIKDADDELKTGNIAPLLRLGQANFTAFFEIVTSHENLAAPADATDQQAKVLAFKRLTLQACAELSTDPLFCRPLWDFFDEESGYSSAEFGALCARHALAGYLELGEEERHANVLQEYQTNYSAHAIRAAARPARPKLIEDTRKPAPIYFKELA